MKASSGHSSTWWLPVVWLPIPSTQPGRPRLHSGSSPASSTYFWWEGRVRGRVGGETNNDVIRQSYWCWLDLRSGADTVDNAYSGEDNILISVILTIWSPCHVVAVYDTGAGGSYQNSEPGFGSRPGADLVAQEYKVPTVTITSHSSTARLELVDWL